MRHFIVLLSLFFVGLFGCGASESEKRSSNAKVKDPQKTDVEDVDIETEGSGLAFSPMEFAAYLAEDLKITGKTHVSVEAGYLDIRQQNDGDKEDIFDFRMKSLASGTSSGHLPVKAASGCAPVATDKFTANVVTSAAATGFYTGTLTYKSGFASATDRKGAAAFKTDQTFSAIITSTSGEVAKISDQKIPKAGSIQLAQAFDASISVNTVIKDINTNLAGASNDLLIGDVGNATDYNIVVLTFYGSKASKVSATRCFFKPGGSATLTKAQYQDLLPLKGIIGAFANVVVSETNGVVVWSATYSGTGSEDLLVE